MSSCFFGGGFLFLIAQLKTELARVEANKFEALLASGRRSVEDLIARRLNGNSGDGVDLEEGLVKARAELTRLWEEGKDHVIGLASEGGKVGHLGTLYL